MMVSFHSGVGKGLHDLPPEGQSADRERRVHPAERPLGHRRARTLRFARRTSRSETASPATPERVALRGAVIGAMAHGACEVTSMSIMETSIDGRHRPDPGRGADRLLRRGR